MTLLLDKLAAIATLVAEAQALAAPPPVASYLSDSTRTPHPKPTIAAPIPGGTITDSTFHNRLTRITGGPPSNRVPSNAHTAAWSSDSTHFYTVNGGGNISVWAFNSATLAATLVAAPYSQTEPCFSRTNPDTLYTVGGPAARTILSYSLAGAATTPLLDLDSIYTDLASPRTYIGGIGTASGKVMAFFGGQGQDNHDRVIVIDTTTQFASTINTVARAGFRIHSAAIDLSGQWVLIYPTNALPHQVYVWNLATDALTFVTNAPYGHDALSYGQWVNMDSGGAQGWDAAQWQLRPLANLTANHDLITPVLLPKEVYLADHTTWNNALPGVAKPVISATYRTAPSTVPWRAWDDEVIAISTDGSGLVYRFCHHHSDATESFWSQPIPNVAPSGRHCLFTSNWDRTLGLDLAGAVRQDVFLVELT